MPPQKNDQPVIVVQQKADKRSGWDADDLLSEIARDRADDRRQLEIEEKERQRRQREIEEKMFKARSRSTDYSMRPLQPPYIPPPATPSYDPMPKKPYRPSIDVDDDYEDDDY